MRLLSRRPPPPPGPLLVWTCCADLWCSRTRPDPPRSVLSEPTRLQKRLLHIKAYAGLARSPRPMSDPSNREGGVGSSTTLNTLTARLAPLLKAGGIHVTT